MVRTASLPRYMVAITGAALLGWAVVNAGLRDRSPFAPDRLFPIPAQPGEPAAGQLARETLARAPLDENPFIAAGARALRAGNGDAAERLLVEARAREPRSRAVRFLLLERYLGTGRVEQAASELAVLTRLVPSARGLLIAALAQMVARAPDHAATARVLQSDPGIQREVLAQLARADSDPALILGLAAGLQEGGGDSEWQRLLVESLVARGEVAAARAVWARLGRIDPQAAATPIYDSRFEGLRGGPPFNWRFGSATGDSASPDGAGGLAIQYKSEMPSHFARQLLALPPGRYSLSFDTREAAIGKDRHLSWTLACQGSKARLATLPVGEGGSAHAVATFTIPSAGCAGQWLSLDGTAAKLSDAASATVVNLAIVRAGPG